MVTDYWKAAPDELILGASYIVSKEGNYVAYDVPTSFAEHIVEVHNHWWDACVWESYYDNIMTGIALDVSNYYNGEQAPLPEGVVPLTEDEWFDYDTKYEAT
jgi:hypothetical protein